MKYNFQQPNCVTCPSLLYVGSFPNETPYCNGFKGKKQKRIGKKVPQRKVMAWCPKAIVPPACRIYGFVNKEAADLEFSMHHDLMTTSADHAFPSPHRYKLKMTYPLALSAKNFCEQLETMSISELFPDVTFEFGEVVEIDNGFKPYYFYYAGSKFLLAMTFDASKTKTGK